VPYLVFVFIVLLKLFCMKKFVTSVVVLLCLLGFSNAAIAQFTVTGKVTDEKNESLPGVSVVVKGTANGTVTDIDGNFSLKVASNSATLSFSYVGFASKDVPVTSASSTVNVTMEESASRLEEVVVTGLASNIKRANAGTSVARLTGDDLTGKTRPTTLDGAMSGKVIGANIVANSGAPGGGISVKLRGISTITGASEPLYVIDGIIVNNAQFNTGAGTGSFNGAAGGNTGTQDQAVNRISDINPNDIESIDILKGPAAAAVYGTRANAGVIVIQTKRGKAGKTTVKLSQDFGAATALNLLPSENWTEAKIRAYGGYYGESDVDKAITQFKAANGKTWDYDKLFFGETGTISNTTLSVSGGNDKTRFYVSGGYNDEKGIMLNTGFKRASARINVDHRINDFIDVKLSSAYYNTYSSRGFLGNDNNGVSIGYTIAYVPNFIDLTPKVDDKGVTIYPNWPATGQNPFEVRDRMKNEETANRFLNSGEINFNLFRNETSNLKFSLKGGADYGLAQPRVYAPEDVAYQAGRAFPGSSRFTNNKALFTYIQSFLTYNWNISGVELTTQAGLLRNEQSTDQTWTQGNGLLPKQTNPTSAAQVVTNSVQTKAQDVAADLSQDFNWGDKVIGRVGVRFDKSSLNGDNTKWYAFPRGSLAVNVANFDGLKDGFFSQIKPRIAFGRSGGVAPYGALYTTLVPVNYGGKLGSQAPTVNGNPIIEPETAQELEFGLDLGIMKNRITLEASYYNKSVYDLLFTFPLSTSTGVVNIQRFPIGDLSNKGIELGVTANIIKKSNLNWTTTLQFWNNKTTMDRLVVPEQNASSGFGAFGLARLKLGASPTLWYGRDAAGKTPVSFGLDAQPKYQMSWINSLTIAKNFDFSMTWHTSQGAYNSSLTRELKDEGGTTFDWTANVKDQTSPRIFGNPGYTTLNYLFDASYIRLRELSLYYTIPGIAKMTNNKLGSIRIGASAQNYFTISKYMDNSYDPEASNFGNTALGANVDLTPFPSSKKIFGHLIFEF
jgi:TonB-linked SusC/RagA family outer membrane protein